MTNIFLKCDNTDAAFSIGRRGENAVTQVTFDFSRWAGEFGAGVVTLLVRRSQDNSAYPVSVEIEGNTAIWLVSNTDTQFAGSGRAEFTYTVNDQVVKSAVYKALVLPDIGEPSATPPDPYETWLDTLVNLGAEVEGYAQEAESAAEDAVAAAGAASELVEHYPFIGDDDFWYAWDADLGGFVSTGVSATGEPGQNGTDGAMVWRSSVGPSYTQGVGYQYSRSNLKPNIGSVKQNDLIFDMSSCRIWVVGFGMGTGIPVTLVGGFKGDDGTDGTDGEDGYSPTVTVTEITGGHRVTITDVDHPSGQSFDVMDGEDGVDGTNGTNGTDGADGYSPTISVSTITGGHRLTITDKNGMRTVDVMDGTNGTNGTDGTNGTTFTPAVSSAGVISWTNDGGKTNPASVDLVAAVLAALPTWTGGSY